MRYPSGKDDSEVPLPRGRHQPGLALRLFSQHQEPQAATPPQTPAGELLQAGPGKTLQAPGEAARGAGAFKGNNPAMQLTVALQFTQA